MDPPIEGVIDETGKTISVVVPEETNVRSLTATFTTTGVSIAVGSTPQINGVTVNDFINPVVYTVTAEDNSTASYTVTVTVASRKITSFAFPSIEVVGSVDDVTKTISVAVPGTTDLTSLVATFVTTGVSVSVGSTVQTSGVSVNDFTVPVVYTVTSSDGYTSDYTVNIIKSVSANWSIFNWTDVVTQPDGWLNREEMNTFCTIADGILSFDSDSGSNQAHYRYTFPSPSEVGTKMTLVLKARGDGVQQSLAWMVDFQNNFRGQVEIRNGQVGLKNVGTISLSASVMHTYMIGYEILDDGIFINVYIDGAPTAALSGKVTAVASGAYIRIGDMSSTNTYKGSLDWIMWTSDGAFFPGSVDIPEGFSLNP